QPELGKPQRNCYPLPGLDFSYGLYIQRTDGGVPEAIGSWDTAKPRSALPRDCTAMTHGALRAGCATATQLSRYRGARGIRCKDQEHLQRRPPNLPPDFTHGITSRPSAPMSDLLQHKYKELWMEQQRALTAAQRAAKRKLQKKKAQETHTMLLKRAPGPAKEESFWHLPRWEKVGPHLSTFPSHDARKKAASA
ncbi:CFA77 protein, partial [Semnornis frantzii]|nr:CFA77 protein [Semnornis frantzii]